MKQEKPIKNTTNEEELKVGNIDALGFKFTEVSEDTTLEMKIYSYEYKGHNIEHTFYENTDWGWKSHKILEENINAKKEFKTQQEIKDFIDETQKDKKEKLPEKDFFSLIEGKNPDKDEIEWTDEERLAILAYLIETEKLLTK